MQTVHKSSRIIPAANLARLALLIVILAANPFAGTSQKGYKIPEHVQRVLFLGNSITYAGQYVTDIEAYLAIRYPKKHFEIINVGLPSETVSGLTEPNHAGGRFPRPDLHERIDRVLSLTKPDLVFACYGMNDGIYMPFDDFRFERYKEGIAWLHNKVTERGVPIVYITPPIFDERRGEAYANVLDIYSDWLISRRYVTGWSVVDIHTPMKNEVDKKRLADSTFSFAADGIHPNAAGHWLMAKQILLYLGERQVTSYNSIEEALAPYRNGLKVLNLVEQRQQTMKDAWITAIGHKRPEMNTGLPLNKARLQADSIEIRIQMLIKSSE